MKLPRDDGSDARARRLFPKADESTYWFGAGCNYQTMLEDFGDVLIEVSDDDYQGDSRVILKKEGRYGFLNFGWGSCSGCDALQACTSYAELQGLIDDLESDIHWFDTLAEVKAYIADEDRKKSYYYHMEEWKDFVSKVWELTE